MSTSTEFSTPSSPGSAPPTHIDEARRPVLHRPLLRSWRSSAMARRSSAPSSSTAPTSPSSTCDPLDTLTSRERESLAPMAQGHDNATIAERMRISDNAVHKHIGNIFATLGLAPDDSGHRRVLAVLAYLDGTSRPAEADPGRGSPR
ncbi:helix-turn-helix transcriptional regulator [Microtetraspora sp. AC03309]|nr:helix-turn-helix transcriptional regulator [Microtetraspora sp. AC03309]